MIFNDTNDTGSEQVHDESLLTKIKHLSKKNYSLIDGYFLEYVIKHPPEKNLSEYWECIEYMTRPQISLGESAKTFAAFLFEYLYEHKYYQEALDHTRKTAPLYTPDRKLRQKIVQLYNILYHDTKNLDIFIRRCELEESVPLPKAISTLDKYLAFNIGNPVYSSRFGYGEIAKLDFLLDTITVNFFHSQSQTITFEQALKSLLPLPLDNIFFLKTKDPARITQMINENPVELEKILERDVNKPIKTAEIKQILKDTVFDKETSIFLEFLKKSKPKIKKRTITQPAFDYSSLLTLPVDNIIELINSVPSITKQKIVSELNEIRTDWQDLYSVIFFSQVDKRLLQTIFSKFSQETQKQIIDKTFTDYKRNPAQFLWLVENVNTSDTYAILIRYLGIATHNQSNQYSGEIRKRLIADNYEFIRQVSEQIQSDNVKRILEQIENIRNFYPEELDAIKGIVKQKFPELFAIQEDCTYHTETAIKNKEQELNKLITEEIPKVADEIGRARGFGDLSENYEFKAAMEKQKRLMHKVSEIRRDLTKAKPIDFNKIETGKVSIGTKVKLLPIEDNAQPFSYSILGPWDSDIQKGIISYLAPFAQKLLNKQIGDEISDDEGKKYKILEIDK